MSFTKFDPSDYVISADSMTAPAWSSNIPTLATYFTASTGVSSSFYLDVYNTAVADINSAIQFSIAYGHISGSGSAPLNSLVPQYTPTRINFGQFRNLVYGDAEAPFNFGQATTNATDLIAITIDRNRYKESLFAGTFNLQMSSSTTSATINLTDNSKDVKTITYLDCGRVFSIISGSNGTVGTTPSPAGINIPGVTASGSYGLFLPDIGTIILNPSALRLTPASGGLSMTFNNGTAFSQNLSNAQTIYRSISSSAKFQLNSEETISSNYIFVRVKNSEYNYTTNPSIITGSGEFIYSNFINSPQTYITSIGLYNTNNDLLAVAKLSKPLVKDFTKEALCRVKLDW